MADIVDKMIDQLRQLRGDDEPLYLTASYVFGAHVDQLTGVDMLALEETGFWAVAREGEPVEIRVPETVGLIESGQPYEPGSISPEERARLMFLGFLAIAGETLMREDRPGAPG